MKNKIIDDWSFDISKRYKDTVHIDTEILITADYDGDVVLSYLVSKEPTKEQLEIAKLITASPELLRVLIECKRVISKLDEGNPILWDIDFTLNAATK